MRDVIFVHDRGGVGGAGKVLLEVIETLKAEQQKIKVILGGNGTLKTLIEEKKIFVVSVNPNIDGFVFSRNPIVLVRSLKRFSQTLKKLCKDGSLVYANTPFSQVVTFMIRTALKNRGCKVIWHVHTIQPSNLRSCFFNFMLNKTADAVICVSRAVIDKIKTERPKHLIYNYFPDVAQIPKNYTTLQYAKQNLRLVFLGSIRKQKGVHILIRAIEKLFELGMRMRLDIFGSPLGKKDLKYHRDLQRFVIKRKLTQTIFFHTATNKPLEAIRNAHALVIPSIRPEAYPTVILEAFSQGRPVLATSSGGTIELVKDKFNGFLFPPGSIKEMCNALIRLYELSETEYLYLCQNAFYSFTEIQRNNADFSHKIRELLAKM